jgi:simple sugar transport system substrate-binding protein
MITRKLHVGLVVVPLATTFGMEAQTAAAQDKPSISTVVKISGIPWFDRMKTGVDKFAAENPDYTIEQAGPASADSAQLPQIVQDLIAKGVSALAGVPMEPAVLEGMLKTATERVIIVVTHNADNQVNRMVDVKAFNNSVYDAALNERLATCLAGKGKWSGYVGSLGNRTHMQWVGSAEENARKYPGMVLVDANNESSDDANGVYEKAEEILRKHPDIKGFQTSDGNDVLGVDRAIEKASLAGKVCLVGGVS